MDKYAIYKYDRLYKNWRVDNELYSLKKAKEIVKDLRENGVKVFYRKF